jgi:molybdate transport system substrate-binding protein
MTKPTLLLALWTGFPGAARASEVTVFAAASLTNVLQELGAAYEAQGGQHVVFNFAASSTLARQIDEGAPADLFFSADEAKMDGLEEHGALVEGTRRGLLSNTLVVVVPADSKLILAGAQDLAGSAVRVLALAEPQSVPAGIYAKEYLRRAGVWRAVVDKVVPTENVRGALAAVESGNADAALVYKTDALISSRVKVAYEVGAGAAPQIAYPLAVVKGGRNVEGGKAFAAYLESPEALAVFRRHGFLVPRALAVP